MATELPPLPDGYSFVVNSDGAYLINSAGRFVIFRTAGDASAIPADKQSSAPESIWYIPEPAPGVMPHNSSQWRTLRFTGESLMPTYSTETSQTIRTDRQQTTVMQTGASVGGDISMEFSARTLDEFLEAVLCGTWTGDSLRIGTARRSFSVVKFFENLPTTDRYDIYNGMAISAIELSIQYGSIAMATVSMMGLSAWSDTATPIEDGAVSGPVDTVPLTAAGDIIDVQIDGESGIYIDQMTLRLGANLRALYILGEEFPARIAYGAATVDGSFRAYFDDRSIEDTLRSGAPFSLVFTLGDGADSYTFAIPRAIHTSRDGLVASGQDGDVMPTYAFSGTLDAASGSPITITREII